MRLAHGDNYLLCALVNGLMHGTQEENGMHREVDWMVPADSYVLRHMAAVKTYRGEPAIQRPASIADNIAYSRKHIGGRCRILAQNGLLERLGRGKYRITELGMRFVADDLSAAELDELSQT